MLYAVVFVSTMIVTGVLWCVISIRAACVAALGTLAEHLRVVQQSRASEVAYLQRLVDSLNQQVLALADQSVQARLSYQQQSSSFMPPPFSIQPTPEPDRARRNPQQEYRPRSEDESIEEPERE